jgi:hypothetical protein
MISGRLVVCGSYCLLTPFIVSKLELHDACCTSCYLVFGCGSKVHAVLLLAQLPASLSCMTHTVRRVTWSLAVAVRSMLCFCWPNCFAVPYDAAMTSS